MSLAETESEPQRLTDLQARPQHFLSELCLPTLTGTLLSGAERHIKIGHTSILGTHIETACGGSVI